MRTYLLMAGVLALCGAAAADVRVFVTSSGSGYGLDLLGPQGDGTGTDPAHEDWPIDPFRSTYSTVDYLGNDSYGCDYYYGYYRVGAYPPIDAPSGTVDDPILIDAAAGEWAYIWFQFRNEPKSARVNGLKVQISEVGSAQSPAVVPTYYLQNDTGSPNSSKKRWDGTATPPGYPEWHNNPQTMIVTTTNGIVNGADDLQMMFDNQSGTTSRTGVALLGAVTGAPSAALCELRILDIGYAGGTVPAYSESTFFRIVPEPAGAVLLAVGVVCVRRRWS